MKNNIKEQYNISIYQHGSKIIIEQTKIFEVCKNTNMIIEVIV